ncbi:insecticidal delta-endotoxin Cry8Ea1 family protein, partial [Bacillus wiedmannii]|uniref:insecticidal delta-endotoxin Cry8Ea1 family protein n=1 Tax=Bacillus wiedmannii TaxID=1890302 RepID=UPI000BECB377
MKNPTDLYPSYHNVLAHPIRLTSDFDTFENIFSDLKGAWEEFGKTGYMDPLKQHFNIAWDAAQSGQISYLALAKAFVSLVGLYPPAAAVVPFVNMFLDFLFPKLFGASNKSTAIYDQILKEVQMMINETLSNYTINNLTNIMDGIQNQMDDYRNKVQLAIGQGRRPGLFNEQLDSCTPPCIPSQANMQNVKNQYTVAKSHIRQQFPNFSNPFINNNCPENSEEKCLKYKRNLMIISLGMYTNLATLELLLTQGYIQFNEKWKVLYNQGEIDDLKGELQERIKEHSNLVYSKFNEYLPESSNSDKDMINTYNSYVRAMTIQSLDMVALWPTLDVYNYNSGIKIEQTRTIFSDIAGPMEIDGMDIHVRTDLMQFEGNPSKLDTIKKAVNNWNYSRLELSTAQLFHHDSGGSKRHCYATSLMLNFKDNYKITALSGLGFANGGGPGFSGPLVEPINARIQSTQYSDVTAIYIGNTKAAGCDPGHIDAETYNEVLPAQKINMIYPFYSNRTRMQWQDSYNKWGYMSSHIPYDLVPENIIGDIDPDTKQPSLIGKGIPAEKGYGTAIEYVSEPLNGANAAKLTSNQILQMDITNLTLQKYSIRIRYATTEDTNASIWFHIIGPSGNDLTNGNHNFSSLSDGNKMFVQGENGKYVLNILENSIELPLGQQTVLIQNTSSQDLFLDRIEFIPIPPNTPNTPSKFTDPEDLEK